MTEPLLSHPGEVEHIEEVHRPKDEEHNAQFGRHVFHPLNAVSRLGPHAKKEQDKAQVDEVKANPKEMVHGISHVLVAGEGFDEEEPTVLVQCVRDLDRHPKTDEGIRKMDGEVDVHNDVCCLS